MRQHPPRHHRAEAGAAARHLADGLRQLGQGRALEQVAARAPAQGQVNTVGVLKHGLDDDVGPRQALPDERQRLQPAQARQAQVEQHHDGGQRVGQLGQKLLGRPAHQHKVQPRLPAQVVAEQQADFGVVFDQGQVEGIHNTKYGPPHRRRRQQDLPKIRVYNLFNIKLSEKTFTT